MKIQLTTARASFRTFHPEGAIIDLPDDEAKRLILSGQAIAVREGMVETTVRSAPERATTFRRPRRTRAS